MQIDATLVQSLIKTQFPQYADLPIKAVAPQGHDNRTFRLGSELCLRLPSAARYADAVSKEALALRAIAPALTVAVPEVVAQGRPCKAYPYPWSIRRWLEGTTWQTTEVIDKAMLASELGSLLCELRRIPVDMSQIAGRHSFFRGCHPSVYGDEVVKSLELLENPQLTRTCLDIWQAGLCSAWAHEPVWFHGDIAVGNILMQGQTISALIDFGTCGVGDPACDFAIAWTYFDSEDRALFKEAVKVEEGTWQRAKNWALWKALVSLTGQSAPDTHGIQKRALNEICAEGVEVG